MARRKEIFYGDTLNKFTREDPKYHWYRVYKYYSTFPPQETNANDICIE